MAKPVIVFDVNETAPICPPWHSTSPRWECLRSWRTVGSLECSATASVWPQRAGVRDRFHLLLSVEDAPLWKPAPASSTYAADRCAAAPHLHH
ncbi:hypothetical protein [Arthrobacter sp. CAN_A1]|uniref:hypothetical protein n=1 Tax=Arthrobacter sp. CAN_A1 TaxID=2787717 RepID=UPI0018CBA638